MSQEILNSCNVILANPNNVATVGPAALKIGQNGQDITKAARDVATALADDKERQQKYVAAARALNTSVPKLVAAIKGQRPDLVSAAIGIIQKAVHRLEVTNKKTKTKKSLRIKKNGKLRENY